MCMDMDLIDHITCVLEFSGWKLILAEPMWVVYVLIMLIVEFGSILVFGRYSISLGSCTKVAHFT